jgi:4-amino-4-deoxy-L-arabinose transferase-like glycosyltransferase
VNNPDALLVLLMVAAGYLLVRALESGRTKQPVWCGVLVGLAFMTKMLQGWMIAGVAMVATSAAWPLAVSLWPGSRPYIGGSTDGSDWNLILGYNGFGRLTGGEGGVGQGANFGGAAGLWRMFNEQVGGQVAWLLPLSAISLSVDLLGRRTLAIAAVAGALALSAGPAAYSAANLGHALDGNNVIAGPSSIGGGMPGGGSQSVSEDLIAYLQEHQGSAKYPVAATGSHTTAPIIVASGEAVVTIRGFNGQDPAPTADQLARMVADGDLRYVLLSAGGMTLYSVTA